MTQPGYVQCEGCGRLFKASDLAELIVFDIHDCEWSDVRLESAIINARIRTEIHDYRNKN